MSTTLTKQFAPLFAAVALACAGAAQAQSLLNRSTYASLVGGGAGTVNGVSFALPNKGPESGDHPEMAQVAVDNGASLLGRYALTFGDGSSPGPAWTGFGSVSNLSAPTSSSGAAWLVSGNPFGNVAATKLVFPAVSGNPCQTAGSCNNQSDYVVPAIHAVPEPETYALLAAGLGAVGFLARRRRQR